MQFLQSNHLYMLLMDHKQIAILFRKRVTKEAQIPKGGRRASDRMVVGFTTTYTISAYHH